MWTFVSSWLQWCWRQLSLCRTLTFRDIWKQKEQKINEFWVLKNKHVDCRISYIAKFIDCVGLDSHVVLFELLFDFIDAFGNVFCLKKVGKFTYYSETMLNRVNGGFKNKRVIQVSVQKSEVSSTPPFFKFHTHYVVIFVHLAKVNKSKN
jgi:hypothetical protein